MTQSIVGSVAMEQSASSEALVVSLTFVGGSRQLEWKLLFFPRRKGLIKHL
jgi:hypothetical protein